MATLFLHLKKQNIAVENPLYSTLHNYQNGMGTVTDLLSKKKCSIQNKILEW